MNKSKNPLISDFQLLLKALETSRFQVEAFELLAEGAESEDAAQAAWEIVRFLKRNGTVLEKALSRDFRWTPHSKGLAMSLLCAGARSGDLKKSLSILIDCLEFQESLGSSPGNLPDNFTIIELAEAARYPERDRAAAPYFIGNLLAIGVPILQTLDTTALAMHTEEAAQALRSAKSAIREGESLLTDEFCTFLGDEASAAISRGEQRGTLDKEALEAADQISQQLLTTS